mgnify:CR=1 FL=1
MAEDLILQPPTCVFQFATPGELPEPRDPNDLIEGLIPEKGQVQLYGPPGIGKSTFALGMSAALAEGVEFIGRKCRKSRVCYQALEGQRGLVNRIRAIEKDTGRPLPDNLIVGFDELALHDVDSVCSFAWWLRKHGGMTQVEVGEALLQRGQHEQGAESDVHVPARPLEGGTRSTAHVGRRDSQEVFRR